MIETAMAANSQLKIQALHLGDNPLGETGLVDFVEGLRTSSLILSELSIDSP